MGSSYEVHFGALTPNGSTVFAQDVGTVIRSDGVQFGMQQHDFDRDGQMDVMFTNSKFSVRKLIWALLTGFRVAGSRVLPHGRRYLPRATQRHPQNHGGFTSLVARPGQVLLDGVDRGRERR